MPELPVISGETAVKIFGRLGFIPVRQKGSHIVLRKKQKGCVIPMHKELAAGTLRSALRQAGISAEEFIAAYKSK
ncbi:MAG: type II toxin-antitoxin system HicA family toxin [Lentisphaerota bacterium]|jgi:predicted RNA binding protein YcfA (HicA-like mRNA interferase family)